MNSYLNREEPTRVFLLKLALLSLVIRLLIGASYYNIFISALKRPLYAFDGEAYSIMGWYIALVLKGVSLFPAPAALIPNDYSIAGGLLGTIVKFGGALPPFTDYGVRLYAHLVGIFYYFFGYAPIILRFFNSLIGVASSFLIYALAGKFFSRAVARTAFAVSLFLPLSIFYSASLQKDTLINFFVILGAHQIFSIKARRDPVINILHAAAVMCAIASLYFLRPSAALVLPAFIAIYAYINFVSAFRYVAAVGTTSLLCVPQIRDFAFGFIRSKFTLILNGHLYLSYLGGYTYRLLPDAYYRPDLVLASKNIEWIPLADCIRAYLNGMAAFILQPSPLGFYKSHHWLALPYAILWYLIVAFALAGMYRAMRNADTTRIGLILLLFVFTSAIGLLEANVEGLMRHREMILPVYIMFAAYGIEAIGKR